MKTFNKFMMLVGLAIVASLTITSCKTDRLNTNPLDKKGVTLVSYGPNPVARGGYMRFMGTGMDQIASITLAGQELTVEPVNKEEVKALIPQDAKIGKVVLKANDGTELVGSKEVTYTEPVGFDAEKPFEPAIVKAGQTLTINGEYLNLVTKVIFAEGVEKESKEFKEHDRKHIVIENFPAEAQTGKVTLSFVATGDTMAQEIPSEVKLNVVLPSVKEVVEFKEVKAGEVKTINGENLDLVVEVVTSTGDTLKFEPNNEGTQIKITMAEVVMDGIINVVTKSGIQIPVATIGVALPKVTKVEGNKDVKAGSIITLEGSDFAIVSAINFVDITGNPITVDGDKLTVTDTKVTAVVPGNAITGAFVIKTTANIDVTDTTLAIVTLKPAITEFAVAEVPMGGSVFAMGTNLDLVKNIKLAGGAVVELYGGSATYFHFDIPYAEAETGKLTLNMTNGETVESLELIINAPECCYAVVWPDPEVETKAGTMMVITVANIDKLTGVIIDGEDCQTIKIGDQLYIAVPEMAGKNSVITLVSENGSISYPFAFVPNTEQKHTLWKGALPISWSDDGKIHISAKAMEEVPAGAELILCYTQVDQVWGQAQICFGDWSKKLLPDGTMTTGDGALVPTDIYGWFEDGILYRETPIVLSDEVLAEMRAHVDGNGDILHIQGSDLIFNEIRVRWTISLEVDIKDFAFELDGVTPIAYPYNPTWSDGPGKVYMSREGLQALGLKAGKSKLIVYKPAESTGQLQINNPSWSAMETLADWNGTEAVLEWVLTEDAIKCISGEISDGSDKAIIFQGDGLTINKITILP